MRKYVKRKSPSQPRYCVRDGPPSSGSIWTTVENWNLTNHPIICIWDKCFGKYDFRNFLFYIHVENKFHSLSNLIRSFYGSFINICLVKNFFSVFYFERLITNPTTYSIGPFTNRKWRRVVNLARRLVVDDVIMTLLIYIFLVPIFLGYLYNQVHFRQKYRMNFSEFLVYVFLELSLVNIIIDFYVIMTW